MNQNDDQEFLNSSYHAFRFKLDRRFEKHFHWFPKRLYMAKIKGTGLWHAAKWYHKAHFKNSKSKSNSLRSERKQIASAAQIKRRSVLEQIFRAQSTCSAPITVLNRIAQLCSLCDNYNLV